MVWLILAESWCWPSEQCERETEGGDFGWWHKTFQRKYRREQCLYHSQGRAQSKCGSEIFPAYAQNSALINIADCTMVGSVRNDSQEEWIATKYPRENRKRNSEAMRSSEIETSRVIHTSVLERWQLSFIPRNPLKNIELEKLFEINCAMLTNRSALQSKGDCCRGRRYLVQVCFWTSEILQLMINISVLMFILQH